LSDDGLRLADAAWLNENAPRQVELLARAVARRKPPGASKQGPAGSSESSPIQEHDPATLVMDTRGLIALWSPGASLLYGYSAKEAIGKTAAFVYPKEDSRDDALRGELDRAATSGHYSGEGWHVKKDGSRFWANAVTLAVREAGGELRGYARIVRDFSERHIQSEKLRTSRIRPTAATSTISGVVTGEFEQVHEASDVFLDLLGYERADLAAGLLRWPDLAAPEYEAALDLAHEEGLRFGACTPYEVELVRKDGTHVPALVVSAVLQLSPFRWIAFVQDLQDRDRYEVVPESSGDSKQGFEDMVGNSSALARVVRQVEVVAPTDANRRGNGHRQGIGGSCRPPAQPS
jgi:formate hydrogenlyase transcriptional activator